MPQDYTYQNNTVNTLVIPDFDGNTVTIPPGKFVTGEYFNQFININNKLVKLYEYFGLTDVSKTISDTDVSTDTVESATRLPTSYSTLDITSLSTHDIRSSEDNLNISAVTADATEAQEVREGVNVYIHAGDAKGLEETEQSADGGDIILIPGAKVGDNGGAGVIALQGTVIAPTIMFNNVPSYADNAAAIAGGLVGGDLYKSEENGSTYLKIVVGGGDG